MPCFPQPGSVTVCEINRDFVTADSLSDDPAKETYGKVLGIVFSPIAFEADAHVPETEEEAGLEEPESDSLASATATLPKLLNAFTSSLKGILLGKNVKCSSEANVQKICWHPHKHILAFISGPNQVVIHDYENSGEESCILANQSLGEMKALEWRPNSGRMLAVASRRGICIWSASYPGNAAPMRAHVSPATGTISRGSKVRWTLVDLLHNTGCDEQIVAVTWSPNGRYLASAASESMSFTIWDVAQGRGTPIRRGLGYITMLKWSPLGDYFFTAKSDGSFYFWETDMWISERWSSNDGHVTGATWDPSGRMILLAFSESNTLGSVHFSSKPPSLGAQLLPVELPEFLKIGCVGIDRVAWDASGDRLAISYQGGNELYCGLIAVYDVKRTPLVSASLVGFIRGPGERPQPLAFAFHNKFKQGPLLSVCWSSGWCCTYPLLYRSHMIP